MNEPISPGLALVDPELATRARAALPDRWTFELTPSAPAPPAAPGSPAWRHRLGPVALVVAAILGASLLAAWQSRSEPRTVSAVSAVSSGIAAAEARPSGTAFAWPRIQRAAAYRLDVSDAARVVYTIRTSATEAALPVEPKLPRGTYSWRVAPVFDRASVARVGAPIVEGAFTVGQ